MGKKGKFKYCFIFFLCFSIFIYGFLRINITKTKNVRNKSKFTIDFKLKPIDLRIESGDYIFYVNSKVIDGMKVKYNEVFDDIYNRIFSKK